LERIREPVTESVQTRLGARIQVHASTHAHRGDRRDHQDPTTALGDESSTNFGERDHRPSEVRHHHRGHRLGVVFDGELIGQQSDGDDHEVDLIADLLESLLDGALRVRRVLGVEDDGVGLGRAVFLSFGGGDVE